MDSLTPVSLSLSLSYPARPLISLPLSPSYVSCVRRCPSRGAQIMAHVMQWNRMESKMTDFFSGRGPTTGLLKILRDAPKQSDDIYTAARERRVKINSRRHMKGMLHYLKKVGRVQTFPPVERQSGEERDVVRNFVYSLTEKGVKYVTSARTRGKQQRLRMQKQKEEEALNER